MSGFPADWLALREPADTRARSKRLAESLLGTVARGRAAGAPLKVIDLGAGTGANLRYMAPLIGTQTPQEWLLVENDPLLLAAAAAHLRSWLANFDCRVGMVELDLATQLAQLPLASGTLVTAAALLDLVSESWLQALLALIGAAGAPVWFALSYDGRMECHPPEPEDAEVRELVNLHQTSDKGFGAALGPAAARRAGQLLMAQGYEIDSAPSDWYLAPGDLALQQALIEGWCVAATQAAPQRAAALQDWLQRRRAHLEAARSELHVGHQDIVGLPCETLRI
ncbi:MAG TPA: hypothetical protein VMF03_04865 [Steroidobacteraceae bacterium]|nr:hypothetical protein [Steroidobacteraceae bacterium]